MPTNPFAATVVTHPDMTCRQMAILCAIQADPGRSTGEYAVKLGVQTPVVTRAIYVLEDAGLAKTAPHPLDGRKVSLTVTAAGAALVRETTQVAQ